MDDIKLPELVDMKTISSVEVNTVSDTPNTNNNNEQDLPHFLELSLLETEIQTGSVTVTWCIDKDWLANHNTETLYLLLCTVNENPKAEWRTVVKLSDLAAYVIFLSPGKNRIFGFVTNSEFTAQTWLTKYNGEFITTSCIHYDNKFVLNKEILKYTNGTSPHSFIDVDIPEQCFAPEPSEKEKFWVNFFWRNKAVDQCEFRRRRLFAYSIQPIIFTVIFVFWLAAFLFQNITHAMIGRILIFDNLMIMSVKRRIDFLTVPKFKKLSWLFIPIPWILFVATVLLFSPTALHGNLLLFLAAPLYLIVTVILCFISPTLWNKFLNFTDNSYERYLNREMRRNKKEASIIPTCDSEKRIKKIQDLPLTTKSIKLRFNSTIKTQICKPYAR